jgi:hypothetical protein
MRSYILAALAAIAPLACAHEAPKVATTRLNHSYARPAEIEKRGLYIPPPPRLASLPLDEWRPRYPEAARALDAWREAYPLAAQRLAQWELGHDDELDVLVDWAITHPYESIGAFFAMRMAPAWGELRSITMEDAEGFEAFLQWARLSRLAACELTRHDGGLDKVARSR